MILRILLLVILVFSGQTCLALSDDFVVQQQIGFDSTPPTVPVGVTTTPVTSTQINISWGTSTDAGVGLRGYQLFRDGAQIATTSANVNYYSDTGLVASTTYAYNVTAFDTFDNFSTWSATSSTTTLPAPVTPTTTPTTTPAAATGNKSGGNGPIDRYDLVIADVEVLTTDTTAEIAFITAGYSVASVVYGETPQYELGSLATDIYKQSHRFAIKDLEPDIRYYFKIAVQNQSGETIIYEDSFTTKYPAESVSLSNVSGFRAYVDNNDVVLSWINPRETVFNRVRVVANDRHYPVDLADGYVLYEGAGERYRHTAVYPEFTRMFYTVFALDEEGNNSSGAIAHVSWSDVVPGIIVVPEPEETPTTSPEIRPEIKDYLAFSDIEFLQNSRVHQGLQEVVSLDPGQPFTIRVAYDQLPEHLKTIAVTISHPEDHELTYSFLLRVNETKTYYDATIEPLNIKAQFPFEISMIDFYSGTVSSLRGTISTVPKTEQTYAEPVRTIPEHLHYLLVNYWWGWLILILLLLITYRLLQDEQPQKEWSR